VVVFLLTTLYELYNDMFRFEKLEVWHLSIQYSKKVYLVADTFPKSEMFGLIAQIKRAALSISSNIAEGSGSATTKDFCNFLDIAIKSTIETVSQLKFAVEMGYMKESETNELYDYAETLVKRIQGLKKYLKSK
jgi:four helix bundle protein